MRCTSNNLLYNLINRFGGIQAHKFAKIPQVSFGFSLEVGSFSQGLLHVLHTLERGNIFNITDDFALELVDGGVVMLLKPGLQVGNHFVDVADPIFIEDSANLGRGGTNHQVLDDAFGIMNAGISGNIAFNPIGQQ